MEYNLLELLLKRSLGFIFYINDFNVYDPKCKKKKRIVWANRTFLAF